MSAARLSARGLVLPHLDEMRVAHAGLRGERAQARAAGRHACGVQAARDVLAPGWRDGNRLAGAHAVHARILVAAARGVKSRGSGEVALGCTTSPHPPPHHTPRQGASGEDSVGGRLAAPRAARYSRALGGAGLAAPRPHCAACRRVVRRAWAVVCHAGRVTQFRGKRPVLALMRTSGRIGDYDCATTRKPCCCVQFCYRQTRRRTS